VTYVFVDTNILIHYRRLEEIDWLKLIREEAAMLVLAPVVIRELDTHKFNHPSSKIRARVRELLANLRATFANAIEVEIRKSVRLRVLTQDPEVDFESYGLRRDVNDDWLLASMIVARIAHPEGCVVLAAADFGLDLKARAAGFLVIAPPNEARLADEMDVSEKRIKQLERENATLRNRLPDLRLSLADSSIQTFSLPGNPEEEVQTDAEIAKLRQQYPHLVEPSVAAAAIRDQTLGDLLRSGTKVDLATLARPGEYKRYNSELDVYYSEFEQYLRELANHRDRQQRRIELAIHLHNDGGAPAEDIDIHMHFPDGFELWRLKKEPREPTPPEPPLKPGYIRPMTDILSTLSFPAPRLPTTEFRSNISPPDISKANSYDVRQHVRSLKHGYSSLLETYSVIYESAMSIRSFEVRYFISAANLPKAAEGKLSVVIQPTAAPQVAN